MITIKLIGGLGNQMFQYAIGRHLSIKNDAPLFLDTNYFHYSNRSLELGVFNIQASIATQEEKPGYERLWKNTRMDKYWYPICFLGKKLNPNHIIENPLHPLVHKEMFDFQKRILTKNGKNLYLEGFWQSEKYFKDIEGVIREDFTLKQSIKDEENQRVSEEIKQTNSVSIHVRRGDYIGSHYEGICEKEYYQRSIDLMNNRIEDATYFIFSEDMEWCRDNLKFGNSIRFIDWNKGKDSYKDMILMSECKHNIMANSSFSWWASWLNKNKDKLVIAPKGWHGNLDYKDIIPDNWMRI